VGVVFFDFFAFSFKFVVITINVSWFLVQRNTLTNTAAEMAFVSPDGLVGFHVFVETLHLMLRLHSNG